MSSKLRYILFNMLLIVIPWLSVIFIGKRSFKRYSISGLIIVIFETINHIIGNKKKWWIFYNKKGSFLTNELPFSIGPYMPASMWILKYTYSNFKKFVIVNIISHGLFAFIFMGILKKIRIVKLHRLNKLQFFCYLHYKAYLLYGLQYLKENFKNPLYETKGKLKV
ncbi:hypothetical protein NSA56_09860 [Oceanobacillus caeni]|uniref:Uncharacterized protein n=2 Tax=Oceanobacillus caeni TaxID=405946 RepID=A0ABR5MFQ4_9BACI|nr:MULTISPECIES: hypothetical protein [Bacillaceae]KKE80405.1 hypothetical protein WH51_02130 [Bacilli bacterium VT-13-104]PZD83403.1 hypothetical protein DEJ64_15045 [Bacilli bacterium]KPH71196.1 hypothetical protein AFL42_16065 [Oceanobacillus caeni]MBU8790670.1 hypothetical protein [Oceanobacillus caeni]MCR1834704.1 hypothetical protein [Oceanobacillus caeni]